MQCGRVQHWLKLSNHHSVSGVIKQSLSVAIDAGDINWLLSGDGSIVYSLASNQSFSSSC